MYIMRADLGHCSLEDKVGHRERGGVCGRQGDGSDNGVGQVTFKIELYLQTSFLKGRDRRNGWREGGRGGKREREREGEGEREREKEKHTKPQFTDCCRHTYVAQEEEQKRTQTKEETKSK